MNKQSLLYDKHKKNIMKNFPSNAIISDDKYFKQKALTIIIRVPKEICKKIDSDIYAIRKKFPKHYYHSGDKFHVTLLGLVDPFLGKISKDSLEYLISNIEDSLKNQKPFSIKLKGINIGNGASVAKIYYKDKSIDRIRKKIIRNLDKNNIGVDIKNLKKKYDINVSWATLIRYRQKKDLLKLKEELELFKDIDFGEFRVDKIELVIANHLMESSKTNILKEFKLDERK